MNTPDAGPRFPPLADAMDYADGLRTVHDCYADRAAVVLADELVRLRAELVIVRSNRAARTRDFFNLKQAFTELFADPVKLRANILRHGPNGVDLYSAEHIDRIKAEAVNELRALTNALGESLGHCAECCELKDCSALTAYRKWKGGV